MHKCVVGRAEKVELLKHFGSQEIMSKFQMLETNLHALELQDGFCSRVIVYSLPDLSFAVGEYFSLYPHLLEFEYCNEILEF